MRVQTLRLAIAAALCGHCMFFTSAGDGRALRRDVDQLKQDVKVQGDEVAATVKKAEEQLTNVQQATDEATKLLTRNSADVGAQVAELRATLERLEGRLAEAAAAVEGLRKELGEYRAATDVKLEGLLVTSKTGAPPVPEDRVALFAEAERRLQEGQFEEARRHLRTYLNRFGGDDQADNAQLMVGESYFREEKYAAAIGEFQKVIDGHPKGDAIDDAFLRNGTAFFRLKYCTDARVFLQELIRRFSRSPLVPEARQLLQQIEKMKTDRKKCTS